MACGFNYIDSLNGWFGSMERRQFQLHAEAASFGRKKQGAKPDTDDFKKKMQVKNRCR
uniref:Uncharacterized protein n=1 Tax=Oryza brachyantha TaxID=4533 RepID=J3M8Y1_ORYBR